MKKAIVYLMALLTIVIGAFAIPESLAKTQCRTATVDAIVLPDGAYGYVPIVATYNNQKYVNFQTKPLQNSKDFDAYVNGNIDKYEMTFEKKADGLTCIIVGDRLSDDADIYALRANEDYKAFAKKNGYESLRELQKPEIEVKVEKEEPRAPIRRLEIVGNNAGNWGFGCEIASNSYNFCGIGSGKTITSWSQNPLSRLW